MTFEQFAAARGASLLRLLVSGVVSDVAGEGLIGQTCGFTRYYDEQTAAEWASATD